MIGQESCAKVRKSQILHIKSPFTECFTKSNHLILDIECDTFKNVAVLGFYKMGYYEIEQFVFPEPVTGKHIPGMPMFKQIFHASTAPLVVYNASWESSILGLDASRFLDVAPGKYIQKDQYVHISPLYEGSSRSLPEWSLDTMDEYLFRNYSCIVKTAILLAGHKTFSNISATQFLRGQYSRVVKKNLL